MGRSTLLTEDLIRQIAGLVSLGNYPLVAARASGVDDNTFYDWLARGREAKGEVRPDRGSKRAKERNAHGVPAVIDLFVQLVNAISEAEANTEARIVGTVVVAAQSNDRAAMAFLERRHPQRWRQHATTELVGPEGGPIRQDVVTHEGTPEVSETLAGILEAMARAGKLPKEGSDAG